MTRKHIIALTLILVTGLALVGGYLAMNGAVLLIVRNLGPTKIEATLFANSEEKGAARIESGDQTWFFFTPHRSAGMSLHCLSKEPEVIEMGYIGRGLLRFTSIELRSCKQVRIDDRLW